MRDGGLRGQAAAHVVGRSCQERHAVHRGPKNNACEDGRKNQFHKAVQIGTLGASGEPPSGLAETSPGHHRQPGKPGLAGRSHHALYFTKAYTDAVALRLACQDHAVAIGEKRARLARGQVDGIGAAPGQFQE